MQEGDRLAKEPEDILKAARRHVGIPERRPPGSPPSLLPSDVAAWRSVTDFDKEVGLFGPGREEEARLCAELASVNEQLARLETRRGQLEREIYKANCKHRGVAPEPGDGWA